jgi:hypothetical protein
VAAQGTDAKGRGGANAASIFRLEPAGSGSKVMVHTNLTLSGAVAQYGRGVGIIQATAAQLMNQFASCLKEKLAQEPSAAPVAPPLQPSPSIVPPGTPPPVAEPASASPPRPAAAAPRAAPAKPISGFALMAKVIWSSIVGLFRRS